MGHVLSKAGVSPVEDKVQALGDAPRPTNVAELLSFVGMINFYGKFVPDLSTKLVPLYDLLQKGVDWNWSVKCEKAFQCAKDDLSSDGVLVHFDPKKSLVLSVDASPKGVGAVLSHKMSDGSEQPIAYASRTLSKSEVKLCEVKLCSNRERGISHSVWFEKVPSLSLWE